MCRHVTWHTASHISLYTMNMLYIWHRQFTKFSYIIHYLHYMSCTWNGRSPGSRRASPTHPSPHCYKCITMAVRILHTSSWSRVVCDFFAAAASAKVTHNYRNSHQHRKTASSGANLLFSPFHTTYYICHIYNIISSYFVSHCFATAALV